MRKFLSVLLAIILIAGIACLAVYCIAVAKDMTFVDYIKSWFEKAPEVVEPIENAVSCFRLHM